ncbi:MAG: alpha-L-rhamnosidase N-terminal domain-containing protein [Spirochaetaceae bacterium]|nr:alpha-L-rhamnosidase N-terminal domain-containing protein [Spirochaetaceae bacterium]
MVPGLLRNRDSGDREYRGAAVASGDSVLVPWPAAPLASHQSVTCRVRVTGSDGVASDWNEPLAIHAPLLDARERGSDLYDGETYDARLELGGWSRPGYDAGGWQPVEVIEHDLATLTPAAVPPVRAVQEVAPVSIWRAPFGETLVDFGQNLVGRGAHSPGGRAGHRGAGGH